LNHLLAQVAKNEADEQVIRGWYGMLHEENDHAWESVTSSQDSSTLDNLDFYISDDLSKCRVYEIWEQQLEKVIIVHDHMSGEVYEAEKSVEEMEAENQSRIQGG